MANKFEEMPLKSGSEKEVDLTEELKGIEKRPPKTEAGVAQRGAAEMRIAAGRPGFMSEDTSGAEKPETDHKVDGGSFEEEGGEEE